MYRTFLTFLQAKEYLSILTERGLLRYDQVTQTYRTTEEGLIFLDKYIQLAELTKGIEQGRVSERVNQIISKNVLR